MTCSQALETMLDAEPADLFPEGPSLLAAHLRSCAKCARVAATMRADVGALAAVMPAAVEGTRTSWVLGPAVTLVAAAAVLLFVMTRGTPVPTVRSPSANAIPLAVARPTEPLPGAAQVRTARATLPVRRMATARYAMSDPLSLSALSDLRERTSTVPASEREFAGVSVASNGGVIVLKTSNPKITVIWFN